MPEISRRRAVQGAAWAVPAVAAASAVPALAVSKPATYRFRSSIYSIYQYSTYQGSDGYYYSYLRSLSTNNQTLVGSSPKGFTIVEESGSPRTNAKLNGRLQLVIAFPTGMVNTAYPLLTGPSQNWTYAGSSRKHVWHSDLGRKVKCDVFVFRWNGTQTQSTVSDVNQPASWAGTEFNVTWNVGENYWIGDTQDFFSNYYVGALPKQLGWGTEGVFGTYTTDNGFTGNVRSNNPANGGWHTMRPIY